MLQTKDEIESWLDKMEIGNYTINDDLIVDVNGDVNFNRRDFNEIPIQFGQINGGFYVAYNNLISLKGCPTKVRDNFICPNNRLESLEYCPKVVGGIFSFEENPIKILEYLPKSVGRLIVRNKDIEKLDILKIKVTECLIHECSSLDYCIPNFKELYEFDHRNKYMYRIQLSAQQLDILKVEKELRQEMSENIKVDNKEKKLKL